MATEVAKPSAGSTVTPRPPLNKVWTRDGFVGALSVDQSQAYGPDYLSASGPHAPRRTVLSKLAPRDEADPNALPEMIADSDGAFRLYVSGRQAAMPFVVRNVEADELHFIQEGSVEFETEVGSIAATRGDFVYIPKSIAYRLHTAGKTRRLIIESRLRYEFVTPYPVGIINFERDLVRAEVKPSQQSNGPATLVLRAWTGASTTFRLPNDPLALNRHLAGKTPVWRIGIDRIQKLVSLPEGGPPYPFLGAGAAQDLLMFNMGSRPVDYRPPIHLNADYDEVLFYVDGGAWGGCSEPGTLTWVPKGVVHHGVSACTPEPHRSWLLETRATLRWTEAGLAGSELMETGSYGKLNQTDAA